MVHNDTLQVRIYTPESGIRTPKELIVGMWSDIFSRQSRSLAWRLFVRNISGQYRQTVLGYAWVVLSPLLMSLVWIFLNSQKIVAVGDTGIPYALYVFSGNLLWQSFILAMAAPIGTVQKEKMTLTKLNFSRESLLSAGLGQALFSGLIQFIVLVPIVLFFRRSIGVSFLFAPVGVFLLVLLGFTFGTVLTPIGLLFTDIGRAIPMVGRFWFFATPVIYPVPTKFPAVLVNYLNPVSPILVGARNWITGQQVKPPAGFIVVTVAMLILLFLALILYRLAMPHIVERMSS